MLKMKKDTLGLDIQQKNIITPQTQKKIDNRNSVISLVSGAGAGVSSTIICSPLDVVKVRIQVQGSLGVLKYSGPFQSIRVIITEEGIRGLFRGIEPALMTVPLFWGMYFCFYDTFKQKLERQTSFSPTVTHLLSAVSAGAIGDIITNPLYVTRTRMQTTVLHHENIAYSNINIGMLQLMQRIYREEGFLAFYRGLGASFLGLSHVALQFPLYEHLKELARERRIDGRESALDIILASITAKSVATIVTYPHEVLRSRLQDQNLATRNNLINVATNIIKTEGVGALWSGIRVNLIRIVPATLTTFLGYEYISRGLKNYFND